jgi:D-sedoheptulose 7-phosphate isomerase
MVEATGDIVATHLRQSLATLERAAKDGNFRAVIHAIAGAIERSLRAGGKLLIAGNGGSAADAQHMAAELVGRFRADRQPLPAIALTTDTSLLTAVGNDFGFEQVFERQVRGLGRKSDAFLAISTSGNSPNVLAALRAARTGGLTTLGFTGGSGGAMPGLCDHCLVAPADDTALIQQLHIVAVHAVCDLLERTMVGK